MKNRTKKLSGEQALKAVMRSQGLAHRAIDLCENALLLLKFGGQVELYRRECEAAAGTCFRVAHELAKEAEKTAVGVEGLPPDLKEKLAAALEAKP